MSPWGKGWKKNKRAQGDVASKFGNKRVEKAGLSFDSKAESKMHDLLLLREKAKEIKILKLQDRVILTEAQIAYIADFKCQDLETGEEFWVEMKGFETDVWRLKRRLWMVYGPGKLEVYKCNRGGPFLHETIVPKGSKGATSAAS